LNSKKIWVGITVMVVVLLMIVGFIGCAQKPVAQEKKDTITVTDIAGRKVSVKVPVERVVLGSSRDLHEFAAVVGPDKEIAIKGEIIPEDNLIAFKPNCKKEPTGEPPIVRVTGVDLDFKSLNLVKETTGNLTATVLPENATNKEVTWTSSDIGKATVSIGGVVTALSKGKCKITVTTVDAGKTATCEVHVK
jgi:hypothetical protein